MEEDVAIKIEGVTKTFKLPHEKNSSIKSSVINFYKRDKGYEKQEALQNISFEVKKGEFFGIVGRNGSGKSTLLKLLAGIYSQDKGSIIINGKLTPFIELGVGFSPELSGRENVFLNGALLGFSRKEMAEMYEDIVDFAEIRRFMDQKLKNYSSGMQVRLAFSIAIRAKSDILLIDEVLAVGDESFQQKCFRYFDQLKKESKTVILVTHDMSSFEKYCDRGILLNAGELTYIGDPLLLSAEYKMLNLNKHANNIKASKKNQGLHFDKSIVNVTINNKKTEILKEHDTLEALINIIPKQDTELEVGVSIVRNDGIYIAFHGSRASGTIINTKKGKKISLKYSFEVDQLLPGTYSIDVATYNKKGFYIDLVNDAVRFVVLGDDSSRGGVLRLNGKWKIESEDKNDQST
jgi:ABC-2 type transport system ATP-binding protein